MNQPQQQPVSHIPVLRDGNSHGYQMAIHDPYANQQVPEDEIDLREIWNVITKYKGLILTIFALFLITTVVATLLMRPIYRADALIEIKPESSGLVKFEGLEQSNSQPLEYKTTQQNIIGSNSVAAAVIDKLNLANNPEINGTLDKRGFISGIKEIIRSLIGDEANAKLPVNEQNEATRRINRFSERLNVESIRQSNLFTISFDSFDAGLSARVANTVIAEFVHLDRQRRLDSNSDAKKFLESEILATQAKLEASERDLTEFAQRTKIVDIEEKGNIMVERLADLNSQNTEVTGERAAAEALWVQSQGSDGIYSMPSVLSSPLINQLKNDRSSLQSEYFNLSKIYKPAYPVLQQVKAQLDDANKSIEVEIQNLIKGLEVNYKQLVAKEALLAGQVEKQQEAMLAIKEKSIQYNILKREWETNRELYTGLLESMKQVGVAGGMDPNNISLIDPAAVPLKQFKPNLTKNAGLSGILGLMVGVGIAFLLKFLDNTVRTPEDLEKLVGVPSLGLIPNEKEDSKKKKEQQEPATESSENPRFARYKPMLEFRSHFERRSHIAEAFRSVRTSLMFSSPKGMPQVIQVVSTVPSEGKSTTAINLALVLADNGSKVLLVDGDLRRNRLHKVFGVPVTPGLSDVIVSGFNFGFAKDTGIRNLAILPSGISPPNPAELLGSKGMRDFLEKASDFYDYIIFDSAPLLGLADAAVLSTVVDGVVYVVHSGKVNKDNLREGIKRLRSVNAPVLGAILNFVDMTSKDYGYYDEYGSNVENQA